MLRFGTIMAPSHLAETADQGVPRVTNKEKEIVERQAKKQCHPKA